MKLTFRILLVSLGFVVLLTTVLAKPAPGFAQEDNLNTSISRKANLTHNQALDGISLSSSNNIDLCQVFPRIFFTEPDEVLNPSNLAELCQRPKPDWDKGSGCPYSRIIRQPAPGDKCEDTIVIQRENEFNDRLTLLKADEF